MEPCTDRGGCRDLVRRALGVVRLPPAKAGHRFQDLRGGLSGRQVGAVWSGKRIRARTHLPGAAHLPIARGLRYRVGQVPAGPAARRGHLPSRSAPPGTGRGTVPAPRRARRRRRATTRRSAASAPAGQRSSRRRSRPPGAAGQQRSRTAARTGAVRVPRHRPTGPPKVGRGCAPNRPRSAYRRPRAPWAQLVDRNPAYGLQSAEP